MSTQDQARWNARYAQKSYGQRSHPSALLQRWIGPDADPEQQATPALTQAKPIAWDVACGTGRNLLFLAQQGYSPVGIDVSDVGLSQARQRLEQAGLSAQTLVHDLDLPELPSLPPAVSAPPALILVFRYLNLALLPKLVAQLADGGRLLVEVHLQSEAEVGGPNSQRFRAVPGAIRQAVRNTPLEGGSVTIEHDYEGLVTDPDGSLMALAQLVARREG